MIPRPENTEALQQAILRRFDAVASDGPQGRFAYPTGDAGLAGLQYPQALLALVPTALRSAFCGIGNVQRYAALKPGERVLDIGCGCGLDTLLAALQVAPQKSSVVAGGVAIGLDASPGMIRLARKFSSGLEGVFFCEGNAMHVPLADDSMDCVLSNGVFSLLADKKAVLAELHRVLRPGGRLVVADQVRIDSGQSACVPSPENWAF